MGLFDTTRPAETSANSARGVNDIPAPKSDAHRNAPPTEQHGRVVDFIKERPNAMYTFDSRANRENPDAELCRVEPNGGRSCIKLFMHSAALFKSMQSLDYFCALPAEPHRTHMECSRISRA